MYLEPRPDGSDKIVVCVARAFPALRAGALRFGGARINAKNISKNERTNIFPNTSICGRTDTKNDIISDPFPHATVRFQERLET